MRQKSSSLERDKILASQGGPGAYGEGSDQLIAQYTEGLEMGYHWYGANNVEKGKNLSMKDNVMDGIDGSELKVAEVEVPW